MKRFLCLCLVCLLLCGAARASEEYEGFDIVVSIAGDVMLASYRNELTASNFSAYAKAQEATYFLQNVRSLFEADDLTVVNLENVLTDRALEEREKDHDPAYWYRGPSSNAEILTSSGVEAVSLANNHTGDYGPEGARDTVKAVEKAGLLYGSNDRTFYFEKEGYRIAVICHGLWNERQAGDIVRRIRAAEEESDFQIVFYHGGKEKAHAPEEWRQRASRRLVDEGADLVIGNHPPRAPAQGDLQRHGHRVLHGQLLLRRQQVPGEPDHYLPADAPRGSGRRAGDQIRRHHPLLCLHRGERQQLLPRDHRGRDRPTAGTGLHGWENHISDSQNDLTVPVREI